MLIQRQIQPHIEAALFKGKTLVLFGPRQVGKTTLAQSVLETHPEKSAYISCDLPEVRKLLRESKLEDLRRFVVDRHLLVLDEAQRVEGIGLALKILHEHFPKTQFLVTGSSSFELGKSVKEPLTGRKREFLLYPISLAELAAQHDFTALRELLPRTDVGALWENFCVNERVKHNHYTGRMVNPWFWRTYDQKELDFVEESGGKFAGFEFKWGGGSARGAKAFRAAYPGSTVEVIEPGNVWDFAGVPVKGAET